MVHWLFIQPFAGAVLQEADSEMEIWVQEGYWRSSWSQHLWKVEDKRKIEEGDVNLWCSFCGRLCQPCEQFCRWDNAEELFHVIVGGSGLYIPVFFFFFNFGFIYLFIYLFMAVLGLRFCARAFSSCGKWRPLFIAVRGPHIIVPSLVVEHRLQTRRLSNCGSRA